MPQPRSIAQFPSQWLRLIEAVARHGKVVTITEADGKPLSSGTAQRMRFRFYRIRTLLRKDPVQTDLYALSECVEATVFKTAAEGHGVKFAPRDANSEAKALEAALQEL